MHPFPFAQFCDHEAAHAVACVVCGVTIESVSVDRAKLIGDREGLCTWYFDPFDPRSNDERAKARAMIALAPQVVRIADVETDPATFGGDNESVKIAHAMVRNRPDAIDEWTVAAYVLLNSKRAQKAWTDFGRELFHRVTIPGPEAETFIQARLEGWIPG